jgi:hypothetical protein
VKLGLLFGSVLFFVAGITVAGNLQEVTGLSELELTNIAANATADATGAAMEEANKLLEAAKNATANATQAGIEQAKSVMANVTSNVSNATSNTTGTAMNEGNNLISAAAPNTTENTTAETQTYENPDIGIRFSYPTEWGKVIETSPCHNQPVCVLSLDGATTNYGLGFTLGKWSKETCNCDSLMDFVKFTYQGLARNNGFSFINDNQTTIGKNYSGWQYQFSILDNGNTRIGRSVQVGNNDNYYAILTSYPNESRAIALPKINKFIESIEFLPIQVPKTPSFMNGSEMEQSNPSLPLESNPSGLQILSHNSFTDSIGTMHVVGEVQNNSPTTATYVEVTGTFYDSNNRVVGTQFTYTNPSDIAGGDKAPFDLTLLSASVPISQVDHYNLVASSQ